MLNSVATYEEAFNVLSSLSLKDFQRIKREIPNIEISIRKRDGYNDDNITITCPLCGSVNVKKNGHTKSGNQKYVCLEEECRHNFTITTDTIFYRSHILKDKLPILIDSFINRDTIRKTKEKLGVSLSTALIWRSKLAIYSQNLYKEKLRDDIEFDETYVPFNFKGTKTKNMPRPSKKRGGKTVSKRELVVIGMAIDSNDNFEAAVLGNGFYKSQSVRMQNNFGDKFIKGSTFLSDSEWSLDAFAKRNGLKHIKIPAGEKTTKDGLYSINTINGIHSEFKTFLIPFRGISTRHILTYIYWFRIMKYLNYRFEKEDQLFELYKEIVKTRYYHKIEFKSFYRIPYKVEIYRTYKVQKLIQLKNIEKYGKK